VPKGKKDGVGAVGMEEAGADDETDCGSLIRLAWFDYAAREESAITATFHLSIANKNEDGAQPNFDCGIHPRERPATPVGLSQAEPGRSRQSGSRSRPFGKAVGSRSHSVRVGRGPQLFGYRS
jgi:hypothetical protein